MIDIKVEDASDTQELEDPLLISLSEKNPEPEVRCMCEYPIS
jgi:hypothetical protein